MSGALVGVAYGLVIERRIALRDVIVGAISGLVASAVIVAAGT